MPPTSNTPGSEQTITPSLADMPAIQLVQTLVGVGVDLSMIITRSSLQSGIALAMPNVRSRNR